MTINDPSKAAETNSTNAIAVIGMAGQFPGASSVAAYWQNLCHGEESITNLSEEQLLNSGVREDTLANPAYVRRAPLIEGIDEFDADFFGFTPQSAKMTDPQHRLFMQCAWHALEDAGYDPAKYDKSIGVYGTSSASGYLIYNLLSQHDLSTTIGQGANMTLFGLHFQNDKDFLSTRVSHGLNLRGPSITVQTACSSSLVAVHLACQSLLSGECDMALAGGVSIRIPHHVGYWYEPGSIVSATGHCRPFDIRADGTIFGSGLGIVVLKPLQAAIDAEDQIHAIIRGSAVNNDGAMKMGFAAPSAIAQADVIAEAHAVSGVDPSTISYVETHGTGTALGDPVEISALTKAFQATSSPRPGPCIIGSVKSNIGHLEVASGIAGLIKTILCLKNRTLTATLHFTSPNPALNLERSPFEVHASHRPWDWEGPRRAGVSSFGVGGTNAHVILEEAPPLPRQQIRPGPHVLLLSAKTKSSLDKSKSALAEALSSDETASLPDVAFTLAGRRTEKVRMAAVVHNREHTVRVLQAADHENVSIYSSGQTPQSQENRIIFLYPGQGTQYAQMARGLYESEAKFAESFDLCVSGFQEELGIDLRSVLFHKSRSELGRTDYAQSSLFAVEYALSTLLSYYGIHPAALIGHSVGEYVAATVAGVFDLPTAIKAVASRASLMSKSPPGAMVVVSLSQDEIMKNLTPSLDIAAVNSPTHCVVSGPEDSINDFCNMLKTKNVSTRRIQTSLAFHSASMDSVIPQFKQVLSNFTLREPRIPLLSNTTGTWMSADEAVDPTRWARQIRSTVRFSDEIDVILREPGRIILEVGPGGSLTASASRHPRWSAAHRAIRLMRHQAQRNSDHDYFLLALGQLWSSGVAVDWSRLNAGGRPRRTSLPGYPFITQRYWINRSTKFDNRSSTTPADTNRQSIILANNVTPIPVSQQHQQQIETTLQKIFVQSLGNEKVDRDANFFELGGDSLSAITIATNASNEGYDLTPQDLFENQTVAKLANFILGRQSANSLTTSPDESAVLPVPPNIAHFLESGLRSSSQWRIPVLIRLDSKISRDIVQSVLTNVVNHHDALRLQLRKRAGIWEQQIAPLGDFTRLSTCSIDDHRSDASSCGVSDDKTALATILAELARQHRDLEEPLSAVYITGTSNGSNYLAMTVHHLVADNMSMQILTADIVQAVIQRLTNTDITLPPTTATWAEWSRKCAILATHPKVIESQEFWINRHNDKAKQRLFAGQSSEPPSSDDLDRLTSTLNKTETMAIDALQRQRRLNTEVILLAALSRAVAQTICSGVIAVDLEGHGRSILKPDVDLRRSVGWFTTIYPINLDCRVSRGSDKTAMLSAVQDTLNSVPHEGIGYGLLRYLYAPAARQLDNTKTADIFLAYLGTIPELDQNDIAVPCNFDPLQPVRDTPAGLGHTIEMRVYRHAAQLHIDWWFDTRKINVSTVGALSAATLIALKELLETASDTPSTPFTLANLTPDEIHEIALGLQDSESGII